MRSFDSRGSDIYRAVHHLSDNAFFFADYSREFFEDVDTLLRTGKVKQVKRLLVYDDEHEVGTAESRKIIQFHCVTSGYDCRALSTARWVSILKNGSFAPTLDIGIFGEQRAYRAPRDKPDYVLGTWTGNKKEVQQLIALFEDCWHEGWCPPCDPSSELSIRELFSVRK
jgi:hypothetical protein